ncbi:ferredoxin-type protein NapF [Thalassotalea sp. PLHSN55]|uniref:ferredoxin-type protein NapF n=1 Tax=Thalassotalea sp. PLHSN55 TaxID=3435888 RepID=UPI003F82905B
METIKNPSRRNLFRGKIKQEHALRLPWVVSEDVFTQHCNQCQDCLSVCETNIIVRDKQGFPKIDFNRGECTFCNACVEACEQPLFKEEKNSAPWPAHINISNKCLATNNIYCQSCQDVCETRAIRFKFVNSSIPQPELNLTDCTSCGACITTCPQDAINFIDEMETPYV